jgi:HPt (histidine-containing phosphotransfer) domain-containing protein
MAAFNIAFEPPETATGSHRLKGRPVDLVHLARQTMGDKDLETEVLSLFARQARQCLDRLASEPPESRPAIAHQIKGAARGIGATAVAGAAEALEAAPADAASLARLAHAVTEAENFICGLLR